MRKRIWLLWALLALLLLVLLAGAALLLRPLPEGTEASLPVLMYHHLAEDTRQNDMIISPETFEAQLRTLSEAGYTAVSLEALEDFVYRGRPLPDKPLLITFDDGYRSNYDLAFPLLEKYGQKAVIFAVGVSFGASEYKDTGIAILPHFGAEEARVMARSGLIEIQSHSFDMHQVPALDGPEARQGMLPLPGESPEAYCAALEQDLTQSRQLLEAASGQDCRALAYPYGKAEYTTEMQAGRLGFHITFTTEPGLNTLVCGVPDCLSLLKRFTVTEELSPEALLTLIQSQ